MSSNSRLLTSLCLLSVLQACGSNSDENTEDATAPVITLTGSASVTHELGTDYTDAGATAVDDVDGSVAATTTGTVDDTTAGTYTLTYTAVDAAGNTSTLTRTVTVEDSTVVADTTAPVITLSGNATVNHTTGTTYTDAGATAVDNVDGAVNATTTGTVDDTTAGTYTLTYTAVDTAGNSATANRTVIVADAVVIAPEAPRDPTEASFIVSDGLNDWESWVDANGSSAVIVDANTDYLNVNEVTIAASQFVTGYRPVDGVGTVIDMSTFASTGTLEFDLKVTTAPAGTDVWYMKIESGTGGTLADYSIFNDNGDHDAVSVGAWQHYSFDLSVLASNGLDIASINNVMIFPDWPSNGGAVYQLDNVAFYPTGAVSLPADDGDSGDGATTTTALGVDFEGPQLTWSSFDTDKLQFVANPNSTGINTSNTVALLDVLQGDNEWAGVRTEGIDVFKLDASNCTVKVDVYKDTIGDVLIKFEQDNGGGWGSHGTVAVANTAVNTWETLTFDTCHWIDLPETERVGGFAFHVEPSASRPSGTMFHFDNIMFSAKEAVVVGPVVGPTALAAAPTLPAADVVSFINSSNTYTDVGVSDWNPNWSQAGSQAVETIAGGDIVKLQLQNYQGVDFGSTIDFGTKSTLHMSVWVENDNPGFDVYVITGGAESGHPTGAITGGTWVDVEVDLSSTDQFANGGFQFKWVLSPEVMTTFYIDNIYFH